MPAAPASEFDLAVVGSGGGAFAAAIRATSLGLRVVLIERATIGGTCVNTGCVPSKALLAAADARSTAADATRFPGVAADPRPVDMAGVVAGKDSLVEGMRAEKYADLVDDHGWDLRRGTAAFGGTAEGPVLEVTDADGAVGTVRARHYLVATGSAPWAPPITGLDGVDHLTSTTAMELEEPPGSMLVLGGGYVALEQAQLFARLGCEVTVLARSRLLSGEEPEVSRALLEVLADEGVRVVPRATVESVRACSTTGCVVVTAGTRAGRQEHTASRLLVATGRRPVTEGLRLEPVGVRTGERGEVVVDDTLATTDPRIWAAGDVTGHPAFVYVASAHGALVVANAFEGAGRRIDYSGLPRVTFTSPSVGAVGMTDEQARAAGIRCECRVLPLEHVPRALVNRDTRGFVKIVAEVGAGRVLGITAVAENAGDLAAAGGYVLAGGMTVEQVATAWSPYLTMAEGLRIAAQSFTTDVSKLSCCAV
ncbi:mercury(II) reductase [Kocuria sp. M4R2S49]|uniref:mercury(II) reductase n=1 Tax=Kocuria rhizosphaericola TaxID=3376284 RepID=UPI003797EAE6